MNNFRLVIRKNTSELKNLLDNLGYHYNSSIDRINSDGYIYVTDFKYYIVFDIPANCIDCGKDEKLFIRYLYKHTECYIREHNKTELTINQKRLLENSIYGSLNPDNNSLPVEKMDTEVVPFTTIDNQGELIKDDTLFKIDGEFSLCFSDNLIKNDNDILNEKTLCNVLLNLSEDNREKYKDRVVFVNEIPIEKQKEFIECFKTNDKDTINSTLQIIMNDYSKDKSEIFAENKSTISYKHSEIFDVDTYRLYKRPDVPAIYCDTIGRKNGSFTTKHKPDKKSKKSARRNNRRAKRNNR